MLASGWPPAAPTFAFHVDTPVPVVRLLQRCRWQPQQLQQQQQQRQMQQHSTRPTATSREASCAVATRTPGVRRRLPLSYSTLVLESPRYSTAAAAVASPPSAACAVGTTAATAAVVGRPRHRNVATSALKARRKNIGNNNGSSNSSSRGSSGWSSPTATTAAAAAAVSGRADQTEVGEARLDKADLAALLSVLGLAEGDVLPELSKKSQALLGLGNGEGEEPVLGRGGDGGDGAAALAAGVGGDETHR